MSTETKLPTLPQETTEQLVALKGTSPEEFYATVVALRTQGWPLRAIGEPFGVSRTAVMGWEEKYDPRIELPEVPSLPERPQVEKKKKEKYKLSEEECQNLKRLADLASTVRRYTYEGSPTRNAADELEALLIDYTNKGVTKADLARAAGVSDSSIKQRLRKYS